MTLSSCLLRLLSPMTVSQTFFVFDNFDNFEYLSGILQNVPEWGFVWYFSHG